MKIFKISLFTILILSLFSCEEKEIEIYNGEDGIYFNKRERVGNILTDSTNFTFVYVDPDVTESVITIPVQLVGKAKDTDRPVSVKVSGGTAIEGQDYTVQSNPVMPANESSFLLEVTLKRSASLQDAPKTIELELEENSYFKTIITHETVNEQAGTKVTALRHKIEFSEQFIKGAAPAAWITQMFEFTPQRFFLVCKVMDIPRSDFNDTSKISAARFQYFILETRKYVSEQLMLPNPDPEIFDENGDVIF